MKAIRNVAKKEIFCGGIANFQCCPNQQLVCKLDGETPDADGECVKNCPKARQFCGSIARTQCCKNKSLVCQLDGNYPDSGSKCAKTCRQKGEKYGSEDCNKCCNGLKCKFDSNKNDCGICVSNKIFT